MREPVPTPACPAGRMFTLFVQTQLLPLILVVQHRVEIRESQVGMLPRFFSVPVSLLGKAGGRKTSALKVRSWQPLERRRDPPKTTVAGTLP